MPNFVEDVDGDSLSYVISTLPNATYSVTRDTLTITPDANFNGSIASIVINVSDGTAAIDLAPFDLTVNPVNDAPYETSTLADVTTDEGDDALIAWMTGLADLDGDPLSVADVLNLGTATFSLEGNTLRLISGDQDDDFNVPDIVVRVTDGTVAFDRAGFTWIRNPVNDQPVETTPIGNFTIVEEKTIGLHVRSFASDVEGPLSWSAVSNLDPALYQITSDILTLYGDPEFIGTHVGVVATVSDGDLTTDLTAFDVTIQAIPRVTVTYTVKWQDGTDANTGTSTLIWNKVSSPWAPDSIRTSTNGVLTAELGPVNTI